VKLIIFIFMSLLAVLAVAACSSSNNKGTSTKSTPTTTSSTLRTSGEKVTLHVAYFPNITHGPGLAGVFRKTFEQELGANVTLDTKSFNAGPDEITALLNGDIDIGYIGTGPAVNGYIKSNGALRIIAGATSGGALFVVRPGSGITVGDPQTLKGKKITTPQLGNTQDIALRAYLKVNGLSAPKEGGGAVNVIPTANSDTITLFKQGQIDGAWVPEPYATRLVQEAGGKVFLDERTLWPNGDFLTAVVIVSTKFLNDHPDVVANFLKAHVETIQWIEQNPADAKTIVNNMIANINSAKPLAQAVMDGAWANLRFAYEPLGSALRKAADDAYGLGFFDKQPDLSGIYDLDPLNKVLKEKNLPAVSAS
jgi:NitT/TauT family transport system substrate-binding protein